jgi:hypothetical protein
MIEYPNDAVKAVGYSQGLDLYAREIASHAKVTVLYNPGLRALPQPEPRITAVLPGKNQDFAHTIERLLKANFNTIVECSQMDSWHSSADGQVYLLKMRASCYRVVVFDGGHHLPTLGLAPDIIIIPELCGYAVHAEMTDGMPVRRVVELAREAGCPVMIVKVPRWGLVKNETSLAGLTSAILQNNTRYRQQDDFKPQACTRMSKYGGSIFAFVNRDYIKDQVLLAHQIESLGLYEVKRIYLAFDYHYIGTEEADEICSNLRKRFKIKVERVNNPVKAANVLFWGER